MDNNLSTTYKHAVEFTIEGYLTSSQYMVISRLLDAIVDEFDLELLESEIE